MPADRATCGARCRDGSPCRRPPSPGQARCTMHGAASPQAKAAAARRAAEERARRTLADLGGDVEPCTDPWAALEQLGGQAVVLVDALRGVVAQLQEIRYQGGPGSGTEQTRGELSAYMQALNTAERILSRMAALGISERRQALVEAQASQVFTALETTLTLQQFGIGPDLVERIKAELGRRILVEAARMRPALDVAAVGGEGVSGQIPKPARRRASAVPNPESQISDPPWPSPPPSEGGPR